MKGPQVLEAGWDIEEIPQLRGSILEWIDAKRIVISRGSRLFSSRTFEDTFTEVANFRLPFFRSIASNFLVLQRLLRLLYFNVIAVTEGDFFVSFDRQTGLLSLSDFQGILTPTPSRILRNGIADHNGLSYFGEYISNSQRGPVHIWSVKVGKQAMRPMKAYSFSSGEIRHIHRVAVDPYTTDLWCMTGDLPNECKILKSSDTFSTIQTIGEGDESWRCISPLFDDKSIFYATDSERAVNSIYKIDRETLAREKLCDIDGPVYYSARINNDFFFAVTAELCPSQLTPCATIWHFTKSNPHLPRRILSIPKDMFHKTLFLPGTISFPNGPGIIGDSLYFSGMGLAGANFQVFRLYRTN